MKLQRISKSLELPCGCEPGHWLYSIASCSFWRGAQRILFPSLFVRASTHLAAGTALSAMPVPINESSSLHHLCWESLGFVLRWSTDQASRLSSCNSCHGKIPSITPYVHIHSLSCPSWAALAWLEQTPCPCTLTPVQTPSVEELLVVPWLGPSCADSRDFTPAELGLYKGFYHNSCVSKIKFKKKTQPP